MICNAPVVLLTTLLITLTTSSVSARKLHHQTGAAQVSVQPHQNAFISQQRQLTFVGKKAGEGYFSADGEWMVFQSEREEGNPFYQIYLADLKNGDVQRLSPGIGKTTCAWIHPDKTKVMFSSTHLDPHFAEKVEEELKARTQPSTHRYNWSFDDEYGIFEYTLKTKSLKKLTTAKGYHAEGSYSPDGQWIAFASNAHAYESTATKAEQDWLAADPSSMMEIYIMRADGSDLKRLTNHVGYDGGPFFSPDGRKITWRRFSEDGKKAEIYTMDVDGQNQKQITKLGAMAWAPYYHPSGDYIIFTTNILGYNNFELYVVDAEGKSEPLRVSYRNGFDGLPVFHPNGEQLSWTIKNEQGESQIYLANWNDAGVRQALKLPPPRGKGSNSHQSNSRAQSDFKVEKRLNWWVNFLASDELGGRQTGSREEQIWTSEVATYFKKLGLKSWYDEFEVLSGFKLGPDNRLSISVAAGTPTELILGKDFRPSIYSSSAKILPSDIVFAGYGLVVPGTATHKGIDHYGDTQLEGHWAMIIPGVPDALDTGDFARISSFTSLQHKILVAKQRKAIGVLVLTQAKSMTFNEKDFGDSLGIPVVFIQQASLRQALGPKAAQLAGWIKDANQDLNATPQVLDQVQIQSATELHAVKSKARSVIAWLETPGASQTVVIGAHGDHLGKGSSNKSLAKPGEESDIHHGADDNASGTAVVMELAAQMKRQSNLKRNYIFAIWSGEELGNLGSSHFLKAAQGKFGDITYAMNFDMVGYLRESLFVQGVGSSSIFRSIIEKESLSLGHNPPLSAVDDPYLPTDSRSFYLAKIPIIDFFTGSHPQYHTPRDTADLVNIRGLAAVARTGLRFLLTLDKVQDVPYVEVDAAKNFQGRRFTVYVGTIPSYPQDPAIIGAHLSGVAKGSPAERAGLRADDIIQKVGEFKVQSLEEYAFALRNLAPGRKVIFEVLREGKTLAIEVQTQKKEE